MAKVLNFSKNINQLDFFSPQQRFDLFYQSFLDSELGQIYQQIPWEALVKDFKPKSRQPKGRKSFFSIKGQLALMFLKAYTRFSDRKLIERLNTDYFFNFFVMYLFHLNNNSRTLKLSAKSEAGLAINFA